MTIRNSRILTYYGYKKIEDISIDDSLLAYDGSYGNKEKTYSFGKTSIISLKTYSHPEPIFAIPEQQFYVRKKNRTWNFKTKSFDYSFGKPEWIEAKNLTNAHYVGMIINNSNTHIPEFEDYDWYAIGRNFSHFSILQEWLHDAPISFIKQFIAGFDNTSPMSYYLALGIQRLYLKAGILSKIIRDSQNRYTVVKFNNSSFIENGYAWYSLHKIETTSEMNIGLYTLKDTFVIQNIVSRL